ncbi:MAG: GtrA family protein [Anaerolineales bacterium]|nr:GtrA family protein [Anaerolineales bacterium]
MMIASQVGLRVENLAIRVGVKPKEAKRFVKFAFVGLIGAIVDFGMFNILRPIFLAIFVEETVAVTAAQTISFLAAVFSNFMWNRYWTYPDSRSKSLRRQFVQFVLVNTAGILIRGPIVWATHTWFGDVIYASTNLSEPIARVLGDNISVALAVVVVMFWNFFVNRYWTYNDVD